MKEENSNRPYISICIPICKRPEVVKKTIDSIYNQGVAHNLFEVCISDNSETDETQKLILDNYRDIDNLIYSRNNVEGFLNSIEALKLGKGKLLKLHNDYSVFKEDTLKKVIKTIESYSEYDSCVFFSMGVLMNNGIKTFSSFNDFLYYATFWTTWSSAFAIWRSDFNRLCNNILLDHMFPHTSLLFTLTDKNQYIVDDQEYIDNIPLKKKGGYNLPDNFVHLYLSMVKKLLEAGKISKKTYLKVENGILKFTGEWKYTVERHSDVYSFRFDDAESIIQKQCGKSGVRKYHYWYYRKKLLGSIKYTVKKVINPKSSNH